MPPWWCTHSRTCQVSRKSMCTDRWVTKINDGIEDSVSTITSKEWNMHLHVNCACAMPSLNLWPICVTREQFSSQNYVGPHWTHLCVSITPVYSHQQSVVTSQQSLQYSCQKLISITMHQYLYQLGTMATKYTNQKVHACPMCYLCARYKINTNNDRYNPIQDLGILHT